MSAGTVIGDAVLTQLNRALEPAAVAPALARALGASPDAVQVEAKVVRHIPGLRCTIAYEVASPDDAPARLIGKLYRSKRRARRVLAVLRALHLQFMHEGALAVPRAQFVPPLNMVLQEYVDAADLRESLLDGDTSAAAVAGRWLARAHTSRPPDLVKVMSLDHELEKLDRWSAAVAPHLPPGDDDALRDLQLALRTQANVWRPYEAVLVHKDYYYAHVLYDGARATVIDFDQACAGDPAFDVGHFSAHLSVLAYRRTGDPAALDSAAKTFAAAYEDDAGRSVHVRLPLYRAYTFVKLAATEVDRRGDGWLVRTRDYVDLALRSVA
jgi:aminoglycoside phosphotransferase (APT) family kinase protein